MSIETRALIAVGIHLIGAVITLIIFYKTGEFEEAVRRGDDIYWALPSDVVFHALVLWEFHLFLFVICSIDILINDFFYKKYGNDEEKQQ